MSVTRILIMAALLPVVVLLIYVFKKDRAEKEPLWLLALLFLGGVLICWPASWLESIVDAIITFVCSGVQANANSVAVYNGAYYAYYLLKAVLVAGLVEEGLKFAVLWFLTHRSPHFNSYFDGIIYAVFVSLGFAALENVLYSLGYGFGTALVRAFTAVPGHMFDAVIMGYFYTNWHRRLVTRRRNYGLLGCLVVPVLIHGLYDFFAFLEGDSSFFFYGFYVLLLILYVVCFGIIRKASREDRVY